MKKHVWRYAAWMTVCVIVCAASGARSQPENPPEATTGEEAEAAPREPTPEKAMREIQRRDGEEKDRREMMERMRHIRLRLASQFRQNERWQEEAVEREIELVREGEEFFEDKEYRDAKDRYLDAVEITYPQWVFTAETMAFIKANELWYTIKDFLPSCQKKLFPLSTEFTRLALVRLADIDDIIDEYELAEKRIDADKAFENGSLAIAYRKYGDVIEHARRMRGNATALRTIREIERKRADILDAARNPLDVAKTSLEAGQPAAALAALDEFRNKFADFLFLAEVERAYAALAAHPEIEREIREQAALRIVALGDAAVAREDYHRAVFWYRRAAVRHANTQAGALAAEKRKKLMADAEIVAAIERQEAEYACKAMLARAGTFASWGKPDEAVTVYDEIVEKYPDTPWAKEAAEAKARLLAAETP